MTESAPNALPQTQPDPILIGAQFLKQFYHNLTHTPTNLHRFYSQSSNATNNISHASTPPYDQPISPASLSSSPDFCWAEGGRIDVSTVDAQCTRLCGAGSVASGGGEVGILLVVTGSLAKKIEESSGVSGGGGARFGESRMFVHTFHLCPVGGGSKKNYCIGNDVFRFVAGTSTELTTHSADADAKEPVVVTPLPELKNEPEPLVTPETTTTKKSGRNKNPKKSKAGPSQPQTEHTSKQKSASSGSASTSTAAPLSAKQPPLSKPKPIKPIAVPLKPIDSKADEKIVSPPPPQDPPPPVEDSKRAKPKAASTSAPAAAAAPPETVVGLLTKKPAGPVSWANRVSGSSAPSASSGPSTKQSKPRSKKQSSTEKQKSKKVTAGDEADAEVVDATNNSTKPTPAPAAATSAATTRRPSPPMGGALYGGSSLYIRNVPEGVRATDIRKLFEPYENAENGGYSIANVSAPSSRGYAFVDYRDPTAASAILKRAVKPPQSLPIATGKSNNNGNSVIFSLTNGSGRMVDLIAEEKNRGVNNNNNQSNGNAGFSAGGRRRYNNRGGGNEKGDDASKQRHFRGNQNHGGRSGQYNNRRGGSGGGGNNGGNNNTAAAAGTSTNTSNTAGGGGK